MEFLIKDTYDFSKKGHMWVRLQDKGYTVTYPVDVYVETIKIEGGATDEFLP